MGSVESCIIFLSFLFFFAYHIPENKAYFLVSVGLVSLLDRKIKMSGKSSSPNMLSIVITDRLNETKSIEMDVTVPAELAADRKAFNRTLLDRLKQFQHAANDLMTEFVEKEKEALKDKRLTNEHLKSINKSIEVESGDDSDEDCPEEDDDVEDNNIQKRPDIDCPETCTLKRPSDVNCALTGLGEPAEKKQCTENL